MELHFPRSSRSLDKRHSRICFWGYDRNDAVCFFIGLDTLNRISRQHGISEDDMLDLFDGALDLIHSVANRVHAAAERKSGMPVYDLSTDHF